MKFYYINLDSSTDRRAFVENQFSKLGITNFERISAINERIVDKYAHPDDKVNGEYICDPSSDKKFFPNCPNCKVERAVLQSHLKAIERGYENGDDYFVILEDDMYIPYDIDYEKLVKEFSPKDAECLQLVISNPLTVKKLYEILKEHKQLWVPWKMILPCAGFYVVTRTGAERVIKEFKIDRKWKFTDTDFCRLADAMIFQLFKTYSLNFPLSYMNIDMGSSIHPDHLGSHEMGTNIIKQIIDNSGEKPLPFINKKY